jgi:hypothetical protein
MAINSLVALVPNGVQHAKMLVHHIHDDEGSL